jgi:hypothetical protein
MKDKFAELEQKVLKIESDLRKKQTAEAKLMDFAADTTKFAEVIAQQEIRAEHLNNRIQTYINRECILTEVSRYARNKGSADVIVAFHLALMRAYNWDEQFWEQRNSGSFTIAEWYDKIMTLPTTQAENPQQLVFDL